MRPWDASDVERLHELVKAGLPCDEIADRLGRTTRAIYQKMHYHGLHVGTRGRIPSLTPEQVARAAHLRKQGWQWGSIGALLGVEGKLASRAVRNGYLRHQRRSHEDEA